MNEEVKKIAGDLEQLLESVKIKPVVINSNDPRLTESEVARELAVLALSNAPKNASAEMIGDCILNIARVKAEEFNMSEKDIVEAIVSHYLDVAEQLNIIIEEDMS